MSLEVIAMICATVAAIVLSLVYLTYGVCVHGWLVSDDALIRKALPLIKQRLENSKNIDARSRMIALLSMRVIEAEIDNAQWEKWKKLYVDQQE